MEDSTLCFNKFILPSPRYFLNNMPCTLKYCQYYSISILIIAWFTILVTQISIFNNWEIIDPVLAFLVKNADIASDSKYLILQNRVSFLAFYSALFNANIRSTADFC